VEIALGNFPCGLIFEWPIRFWAVISNRGRRGVS
jgi:hypothetical protein